MSVSPRSRICPVKLAGIGAIAATILAGAPAALAAPSGGAAVTPAVVHAKSAPFTIGLSATTAQPGQMLTISGLAAATWTAGRRRRTSPASSRALAGRSRAGTRPRRAPGGPRSASATAG